MLATRLRSGAEASSSVSHRIHGEDSPREISTGAGRGQPSTDVRCERARERSFTRHPPRGDRSPWRRDTRTHIDTLPRVASYDVRLSFVVAACPLVEAVVANKVFDPAQPPTGR